MELLRYTDIFRKVLALANQEAQRLNHEYIAPEHILLGLVKEGSGIGANVLKNLNIDLRKARLEVEKLVNSGPDMVTMGTLPKTPLAKKIEEYAIEEARSLNHNYASTEHLLLALLREKDGVVAQVFANSGLTHETIREEVLNLLGKGAPTHEANIPAAQVEVTGRQHDDVPGGSDLVLYIDSGEAPPKIISDVLVALNDLNIAAGGLGMVFRTDGHEIHEVTGVEQ